MSQDVTVTMTFTSSQPLTHEQLLHLRSAVDIACETLPGKDKEHFLDIPEYTTTPEIIQEYQAVKHC